MEKITSLTFYNSITNEFMVELTLYKKGIGYCVLTDSGNNIGGKNMLDNSFAVTYFNDAIKEVKQYYQSQGIIYNTK
jgi:histidinol phosphatase-like PHP family hydrolase